MQPLVWDYYKYGFKYDIQTNELVKNNLKIPHDLALMIVDHDHIHKLSYLASKGFEFVDVQKSSAMTNGVIDIDFGKILDSVEITIDNIHDLYRKLMKGRIH